MDFVLQHVGLHVQGGLQVRRRCHAQKPVPIVQIPKMPLRGNEEGSRSAREGNAAIPQEELGGRVARGGGRGRSQPFHALRGRVKALTLQDLSLKTPFTDHCCIPITPPWPPWAP